MQPIQGSADFMNDVLRELFEEHGVEAVVQSGRVTFPNQPTMWANGEMFAHSEKIVQLDVRLGGFDGDRVLIESMGGFGTDLNDQANFAIQSFANASFHVFLPAFFGRSPCHGTGRETWIIGEPRDVYSGPITSLFGLPPEKSDGSPNLDFYPAFIERLKTQRLPKGVHWIRIYQMRNQGEALANEVLLDNRVWPEMQAFMAEYSWPSAEKTYDVRVFLVVKDSE